MNKLYKKPLVLVLMAAVLLSTLLLGPTIVFNLTTKDQRPQSQTDVVNNDIGIVFGSGLRRSGEVSGFLADRLDVAVSLYNQGKIKHIIVSGDNRTVEHNEPAAMALYLVEQNVPASDITEDFGGRSTLDTCNRANEVFGVDKATLITHTYHLPRALALCSSFGVDAVGVGPETANFANNLREILSSWKAAIDIGALNTRADVLGEPEPILID